MNNDFINDDLTKVPLVDLLKELSQINKDIDILMLKYEKLRFEIVRRFPPLEKTEEFKPKGKTL